MPKSTNCVKSNSPKASSEKRNPDSPNPIRRSGRFRKSVTQQPIIEEIFVKKRRRETDSVPADEKILITKPKTVKGELDTSQDENLISNNYTTGEKSPVPKEKKTKIESLIVKEPKADNSPIDDKTAEIACTAKENFVDQKVSIDIHETEGDIKKKDLKDQKWIKRCPDCNQNIYDPYIKIYNGHPQNALEECIALTDEKLVLASGDNCDIMERPHINITGYSIYDKDGHLCPIDGGLIETDVRLYLSGYLKSICSETAEIDGESVPVKDIGPIIEWSIHGFDGGQNNCIILSSEFGEYNLLKPNTEYAHLMDNLYERIRISKTTIEYLEEFHHLLPSYEDLLAVIKESTIPEMDNKLMTEEMLHKHARFICEQVVSLEVEDEDEPPLITLPCMRELIKLFGIKFGKTTIRHKIAYSKKAAHTWSKATTTPIVRKTFEMFFSNQLDKAEKNLGSKRKRCGICDNCQKPDCGKCNACRAMAKFGGSGKTKKACKHRNCPNMAVKQAEESDPDNEDEFEVGDVMSAECSNKKVPINQTKSNIKTVTWLSDCIKSENNKMYYTSVKIGNLKVKVGDFVMVDTSSPSIPHFVTKVVYMWKEQLTPKTGYFHCQIFCRASDTVLGKVSDPREIFLQDTCCHRVPLLSILRLAEVEKREIPLDWFKLGGEDSVEEIKGDNGKTYYYNKLYDKIHARFEDLPVDLPCPNPARVHRYCPSCDRQGKRQFFSLPRVVDKCENTSEEMKNINRYEWGAVKWKEFEYKKGNGVFLKPETIKMKNYQNDDCEKIKLEKVDETIYTEYYRKNDACLRGSNADTVEPYCVAYINGVFVRGNSNLVVPQDIFLRVNVMYRPENTKKKDAFKDDLNLLYWSNEEKEIAFSSVVGLCNLVYIDNLPDHIRVRLLEWSLQDHNRFYFRESYDKTTGTFESVPDHAKSIGDVERVKIKGKGKGKGKRSKPETQGKIIKEEIAMKPLRMLDVFAGCGGLSEGLHQSGAAISNWAIEQVTEAAKAYQLNNNSCTVFTDDCNKLLRLVLEGKTHTASGQRLPAKGDVELLCGGPPCQGFSGMNRFNSRDYSNFKNSLVASFLSYCDYYRPKYFILENVRNFVAYKKGMVLKLTLRCLLQIGYQCTFGIVQAGNYGVPQTRRRLIIFAAAPGCRLPEYPVPTHVFNRRACSLSVVIDGKRYNSNLAWYKSAPKRTCTIRDAMSDLPPITNGAVELEIDYGSAPKSDFQRIVRSKDVNVKLRDHICKNMAPLIQARMCRIPTTPGSDWRDLPNIAVTLSDGTRSKILQYWYHDIKNGRGPGGSLRGVCACAAGDACGTNDKQDNTLIPWCLPHTGNRHNNWAGLYGRISWNGYFSTTVTDPEPMGKQGRILHPEQNRVVSVRECARSQGFPDTYQFVGNIQDKHRQIGNAVPPPLGAALGREIKKVCEVKVQPL